MESSRPSRAPRIAIGILVLLMGPLGVVAVQSQQMQRSRALNGLDQAQRAAFADGLEDFREVETLEDGVGPVFNARSCAECHAHPFIGGSSPDLRVSRVTRFGRTDGSGFDPLTGLGGSLLQPRSVNEIDRSLEIRGEVVPPEANVVSRRITPPLFGDGLIEAIPTQTILQIANAQRGNPDGISGVPNMVFNPETRQTEVGRFGWKAHVSTLHIFAGDAYLNEMGITNPTFPDESLPQGQPVPPGTDLVEGLEADDEDVRRLETFMAFLAPPARGRTNMQTNRGERIFAAIGCATCHVPSMRTGNSSVSALRNQLVSLYSDLLLHDMGDELADGVVMGTATGREWRTTPLWGLSQRRFLLHDGRATTVEDAIRAHGGEALASRNRALALPRNDASALVAFLKSL